MFEGEYSQREASLMALNVTNTGDPKNDHEKGEDRSQGADNVQQLNVEHRNRDVGSAVAAEVDAGANAGTDAVPAGDVAAEPAGEVKDGLVKWFDAVKGYGFFVPSDNSTIQNMYF